MSYQDFTNNDLKYATKSGGLWTSVIADGDSTLNATGQFTSLALDASGGPHVSYYDQSLADLMYAAGSVGTGVRPSFGSGLSVRVFPNPVSRDEALIRYEAAAGNPGRARDIRRQRTPSLDAGDRTRLGRGPAAWTGLDAEGRRLAPGTYFLRLVAGGRVESARVTVVR